MPGFKSTRVPNAPPLTTLQKACFDNLVEAIHAGVVCLVSTYRKDGTVACLLTMVHDNGDDTVDMLPVAELFTTPEQITQYLAPAEETPDAKPH